jgi:hypothetical protein
MYRIPALILMLFLALPAGAQALEDSYMVAFEMRTENRDLYRDLLIDEYLERQVPFRRYGDSFGQKLNYHKTHELVWIIERDGVILTVCRLYDSNSQPVEYRENPDALQFHISVHQRVLERLRTWDNP